MLRDGHRHGYKILLPDTGVQSRCSIVLGERCRVFGKRERTSCLIRETPVKYWAGGDTEPAYYRPQAKVENINETVYSLLSPCPKEFRVATAAPYSVVATMEPQRLTPVQPKKIRLGRKDDIIQSIDREELVEMYDLENLAIDSLTKTQKQPPFKARRVDLTRKDRNLGSCATSNTR